MITKKNCVLLCFQSFLCAKHFVFNEGNFYSRSFPTHSRTSVENSTTFQEYPTIFQFSRTFQGSCEPWFPSFEWHWTHILTGLDLWNVQTVQLYSWDILTALFPVLCILTKQHGIRGGKYLLKTSGNNISETLIFKMSLQYMPHPSRTCAFGASYKATYYSLSDCYLETFWQPCLLDSDLSTG